MGVFLPEMDSWEEAEHTARHGAWASIGFAAMTGLGFILFFSASGVFGGYYYTPTAQMIVLGVFAVEIVLALIAAYRFWNGRGLVIGTIVLLLFLFEVISEFITMSFPGILGYVLRFAIIMGLINGLRAAWVLRSRGDALPSDIAEAFE